MKEVLCFFSKFILRVSLPPHNPATSSISPRETLDSGLGLDQSCPPAHLLRKGGECRRLDLGKWVLTLASCQNHPGSLSNDPEPWVFSPEIVMFFKLPSWLLCASSEGPLVLTLTLILGRPRKVMRVLLCDLWGLSLPLQQLESPSAQAASIGFMEGEFEQAGRDPRFSLVVICVPSPSAVFLSYLEL